MRLARFSAPFLRFSCLFLASCTVHMSSQKKYENIKEVPSLPCATQKALDSSVFALGEWPTPFWWEAFELADLNFLMQRALEISPSLNQVRAHLREAEQLSLIARARLFPLITFNATDNWEFLSKNGLYKALNPNLPRDVNVVDLTFNFRYEFDFWGKNANLFEADIGRALAQAAEVRHAELITTTALAQAYFALQTNLMRKRLYERLNEIRMELYDLESFLEKKALRSRLTPLFSSESLFAVEELLVSIDEEIALAIHLINTLSGVGPDSDLTVKGSLPPVPKTLTIPENLSLNLLARRPDLRAQIWRVEALSHEVGAAIADFYPDFNLSAFMGLESTIYRLLFRGASATAGVSPAISLPIFTAGAIKANVGVKKALFDQAVFGYNDLVLSSVKEVADVLIFAQTVYEKKAIQEKTVASTKERYELRLLRQRSALDSILDVYQVEAEWIEAQLKEVTLLYNQYVAQVRLIKALGGGYVNE